MRFGSVGTSIIDSASASKHASILYLRENTTSRQGSGALRLYTCEFSGSRRVFQYDLLAANISASEQIVGTGGPQGYLAALQLGPDGKIYMARRDQEYLGVINAPDLPGTDADFQDLAISLGGRTCGAALPCFVNDLLLPSTSGIGITAPAITLQCMVTGNELVIGCGANVEHARLSIFRSEGSLVHDGRLMGGTTRLPLAQWATGFYVARITRASGHATAPFVVAR